jgi:hypothetical protein
MKATGRTNALPESQRTRGVPEHVRELERTREIPVVPDESAQLPVSLPSAIPERVIPTEETVPFQSCIERTLMQEVLRRQSAEEDEDHSKKR